MTTWCSRIAARDLVAPRRDRQRLGEGDRRERVRRRAARGCARSRASIRAAARSRVARSHDRTRCMSARAAQARGTCGAIAARMSLVFPHTFVPWFRSVAPYIHAYRGKTFVVAIAGELIAAGKLQRRSRRTWRSCTRWASSWCWCTAFGRRSNEQLALQGPRVALQPRPAHHRRGRARLRAGGRRPAALRDRGGVLAGPAEHADGQRHRARRLGQLPHRAAGRHRRRRRLHAQRRRAQGRRARRSGARSTSARWCCCRRSASRRPARRST